VERPRDIAEASRALESTLVKQLLESSGAFRGNGLAGSQVNAQMFMEVLADAVSKSGGFGLAKLLQNSLEPQEAGKGDAGPGELPAHPHGPHDPKVTSGFGARLHPVDGHTSFHTGIDLRAAEGTTVLAALDGVVKSAGPRGGYGNAVEIDHGNGLTTLYAHAAALSVKPGEAVVAGQPIADVGQTGKTTGPHLHFEVRSQGRPIDPKKALNAYGVRAEATIEESRE
jgi:murein DD-endopeptidase MepM/ murein hydrolase activator NlpD